MTLFTRFIKDESGATAIEYGLIAAIVSLAIIGGLNIIGPQLETTFTTIGETLQTATGSGGGGGDPAPETP